VTLYVFDTDLLTLLAEGETRTTVIVRSLR